MTSIDVKDKLFSTVLDAVRCLPTSKQAAILLDTSLALIEAGQCGAPRLFFPHPLTHSLPHRYGPKVEEFLEVYLKTPGLLQADVTKALLARGSARRAAAERLMAKAKQGTNILHPSSPALIEGAQTFTPCLDSIPPTNK